MLETTSLNSSFSTAAAVCARSCSGSLSCRVKGVAELLFPDAFVIESENDLAQTHSAKVHTPREDGSKLKFCIVDGQIAKEIICDGRDTKVKDLDYLY